jgi:HK97 gp10 family phage protein
MATRRRLGGRILTKKALTLEGIPELIANANALMRRTGYSGGEVAQEFKRGIMAGALIIRDEAKDLVPVVTGRLQSAIFAAYGDKRKPDVLVGVNTRIPVDPEHPESGNYAGIVEFGDDERAPQPYMRPAIQSTRPVVARIMSERLRKAISDLAGK